MIASSPSSPCPTLVRSRDTTVKHFNLAAANFGVFYEVTFWQIYILADFFYFRKKKSVISAIALFVLCMQILHADLQFIHDYFYCFPHCIGPGV